MKYLVLALTVLVSGVVLLVFLTTNLGVLHDVKPLNSTVATTAERVAE